MADELYGSGATTTLTGAILIIVSVVFFLSGMGLFRNGFYIFDETIDVLVAFFALLIGMVYIFTEAGKPGKPKFKVQAKEQKLELQK
jgi:hypothetical protein